jgi:hypothetical protein
MLQRCVVRAKNVGGFIRCDGKLCGGFTNGGGIKYERQVGDTCRPVKAFCSGDFKRGMSFL